MNGKIATGVLALIVAVSVAGCSDESSNDAASTTTSSATTASTTTQVPTTLSAAPTTEEPAPADSATAEAPDAPPAADPAIPGGATSGVTGEELYQQTCNQFLPSIDALEQTGISDRAKSVEGLRTEMTTAPSWNTVPPSDQSEILRGLDAAGAGQC